MLRRRQLWVYRHVLMALCCLAVVLATMLASAAAGTDRTVAEQHSTIGLATNAPRQAGGRNSHPKAQWFGDAGLGLFLHWGISSVEGKHELSWGMLAGVDWNPNPILPAEYFRLADRFKAEDYNPDRWLKAAAAAGFKYAVLTTKHHDGYALWPSRWGDFSTRTHLGGRDLVRPFVAACRRNGLKTGLYYSMPDWYFNRQYMSFRYGSKGMPDSPHFDINHKPTDLPKPPANRDEKLCTYLRGQIEELLTNYGRIDLLWFDGSVAGAISRERILELQPGILLNDRQHGHGDFKTFELSKATTKPEEPWEYCFSMSGSWGYQSSELLLPLSTLLARLANSRTWGGNVLANYAPRSDGRLPDAFYQQMTQLKSWMAVNRAAVFGTRPGPYPEQSSVPVTVRGKTWYLFLLPKTGDEPGFQGDPVLQNRTTPKTVRSLRDGRSLESRREGERIRILVPPELRTALVDVLEVVWP
jgi:alpha-L-fucosidase